MDKERRSSSASVPPRSPITPKMELPIGLESMLYKRDGVVAQGATPQSVKDSNPAAMDQLLSHILAPLLQHSPSPDRPVLSLLNVATHIARLVNMVADDNIALPWLIPRSADVDGRIGSHRTELVGLEPYLPFDGMEVCSEFVTRTHRPNTCVCKGKWQYEVSLETHGDMQFGWCSVGCTFQFPPALLGDTEGSFGYNGSAQIKTNGGRFWAYGEEWLPRDVIGCLLDLDNGTVSYTRNGVHLGPAFDHVSTGPGRSYMPAVSVTEGEKCIVNFGSRPLRYPVSDYKPLVDEVGPDSHPLKPILECLARLASAEVHPGQVSVNMASVADFLSSLLRKVFFLVGHHLLTPFFSFYFQKGVYSYVTSSLLIPFLIDLDGPVTIDNALEPRPVLARFLQLLGSVADMNDQFPLLMKYITEAIHLVHAFSPLGQDLQPQLTYAVLLLGLLRDERCCVTIVADNRVRFSSWFYHAMHSCLPRPSAAECKASSVWWQGCPLSDDGHNRERHEEFVARLVQRCSVMERVYQALCRALLVDSTDYSTILTLEPYFESPRLVLAKGLRQQYKNLNHHGDEMASLGQLSGVVVPLLKALWETWDAKAANHPNVPQAKDLNLLDSMFYEKRGQCSDYSRVGGSVSYLRKEYKDALEEGYEESDMFEEDYDDFVVLLELADTLLLIIHTWTCKDLILGAQWSQQIKELNTKFIEYRALQQNAGNAEFETLETVHEFLKYTQIALEQNARTVACFRASVYSEGMADLCAWCCRVTMSVITRFLGKEELFGFLPEHYIRVMCDCFFCLYFHPKPAFSDRDDYQSMLDKMALLLCQIVPNRFMVLPDSHDMATQYMSMFCSLPDCRAAMSRLPADRLKGLYCHIMECFSDGNNHNWIQAVVVASRLWMVPWFAGNAVPSITPHPDMAVQEVVTFLEVDYYASKFMTSVSDMTQQEKELMQSCMADSVVCTALMNSLLNRLNFTFSELVGIMQELQPNKDRSGSGSDYHKRLYRTCTFNFNLVLVLLRLTETLALLCPAIWLGKHHPTAGIMLPRLCQTLGQILTRFATRGSLFEQLPSLHLKALKTVKPGPLLVACAGVMMSLTVKCDSEMRDTGVERIAEDTGLQLPILADIMGVDLSSIRRTSSGSTSSAGTYPRHSTSSVSSSSSSAPVVDPGMVSQGFQGFSLKDVEGISPDERALILQFVELCAAKVAQLKEREEATESSDNLCSICCAQSLSVKFVPCGHLSCLACISYQMMNDPRCFFCKKEVESFVSLADVAEASDADKTAEGSSRSTTTTTGGDTESGEESGMVCGNVKPPADVRMAENRVVEPDSEELAMGELAAERTIPSDRLEAKDSADDDGDGDDDAEDVDAEEAQTVGSTVSDAVAADAVPALPLDLSQPDAGDAEHMVAVESTGEEDGTGGVEAASEASEALDVSPSMPSDISAVADADTATAADADTATAADADAQRVEEETVPMDVVDEADPLSSAVGTTTDAALDAAAVERAAEEVGEEPMDVEATE